MRVMALSSTSFFAKYLRVGEDGPGRGHLCHTDTFLVLVLNCKLSEQVGVRCRLRFTFWLTFYQ